MTVSRVILVAAMSFTIVHCITPTQVASQKAMTLDICQFMCSRTTVCPADCPQSYLGPWAKKELHKRGNFHNRHLSFDDHGWFLRLLGRLDRK